MKRIYWAGKVLIVFAACLPVRLHADEFETGVTFGWHSHNEDRFSGGVYRFRPGLYNPFQRVIQYRPFAPCGSAEVFFRFRGPIGENHSFGIAYGEEEASKATTTEVRTGYFTRVKHTFDFRYLLFTYHYSIPIRSYFRNLSLEVGGGLGLVPLTAWHIKGYQTDLDSFNRRYDALLESNSGFQYRLELVLVKKWRAAVFRVGSRIDYRLAGDFTGRANRSEVRPFTMTDGTHALTPDLLDLVELQAAVRNQYLDPSLRFEGLVKGATEMTWGSTGIFVSVGARF
jgi:hypothetical protein